MAYDDPISQEATRADVGLDKELKLLRDALVNEVPWMGQYVYLRAYTTETVNAEGQKKVLPYVYMGGEEYYPAFPNDNVPAMAFFIARGPAENAFSREKKKEFLLEKRDMSLVFWCDLTWINPSYKSDYIYTESIKKEFLSILKKNRNIESIGPIYDEHIETIYDGFTITVDMLGRESLSRSYNRHPINDRKQYGIYPYAALRIDFVVSYYLEDVC